nr:unnamed protein product [Digitaria exilis]
MQPSSDDLPEPTIPTTAASAPVRMSRSIPRSTSCPSSTSSSHANTPSVTCTAGPPPPVAPAGSRSTAPSSSSALVIEIMAWEAWIMAWGKFLMGSWRILKKEVAVKTRPASRCVPVRTQVAKTRAETTTGALQRAMMLPEMEYMKRESQPNSRRRNPRMRASKWSSHAWNLITRM